MTVHAALTPAERSALERTRFVVVGVGGLGCPTLLALLAAGARRFSLWDPDRVDASNLQRQVLFDLGDVGALKVEAAAAQLRRRRADVEVETQPRRIDAAELPAWAGELDAGDVVLEGSDSPALKFAMNDACLAADRKLVVGGVIEWRGQAMAVRPGATCYRCVYEAPPPREHAPRCADVGVMGAGAGLIGHLSAALAVRMALPRLAAATAGELHTWDFLRMQARTLAPRPRPACPACAGAAPIAPEVATPSGLRHPHSPPPQP